MNQYGSVFGHLEIDSLGEAQLKVERTSLELLLSADEKDACRKDRERVKVKVW
ncbi:MAG TPA: hypothetical protein VJ385_12165 [Fibrobacteria bacterium]|nr:hypothetical protein [Fibrobacteria bacterium]